MNKELIAIAELSKLPEYKLPLSLDDAKLVINQLGKNLHEHAYILGKLLIWVKREIGHGNFENWIEDNIWFSVRTAQSFAKYAIECDKRQLLLEYPLPKSETIALLNPPESPIGTYQVIVIDPPWPYGGNYNADTHRIASPYPEMSIEELMAFPIPSAPDCVLWCWVTNAFMHDAYHLLEVWGFQPHTILTWDKQQTGVGYYLRGQTEHCILATKGKPQITHSAQGTLLSVKAMEHSRKPEEFYRLVESLCPGKKYDMFARKGGYTDSSIGKHNGWEVWGNEV